MKHIKMSCKLNPDQKMATLTIISQTHFGSNFGSSNPVGTESSDWSVYGDCAFNLGRTCLVGHPWNEFRKGNVDYAKWLLMPTEPNSRNRSTVIKVEDWIWIKKLVEEYNKWGETQ